MRALLRSRARFAPRVSRVSRGRPVKLAYLHWEPADADAHPFFAEHRAEVAQFAAGLDDPELEFVSSSYPELWQSWQGRTPPLLPYHLAALRDRYALPRNLPPA